MSNQFGHILPQAQCFAKYFAGLLDDQELDDFKTWIKDHDEDRHILDKMPNQHDLKKSFELLDEVNVEAACTALQKKLFGSDWRYIWLVRSRLLHFAAAILCLVITSVLIFVFQRRGATEKTKEAMTRRGVSIDPGTIRNSAATTTCVANHKVIMSSEGGVTIISSPGCAIVVDAETGIVRVVSKDFNGPVSLNQKSNTGYIKYSDSKTQYPRIGMIAGMRR